MKVVLSIIYNCKHKVTTFAALKTTFLEAISEATPIGTNTMLTSKNAEITCMEKLKLSTSNTTTQKRTPKHSGTHIVTSSELQKSSS